MDFKYVHHVCWQLAAKHKGGTHASSQLYVAHQKQLRIMFELLYKRALAENLLIIWQTNIQNRGSFVVLKVVQLPMP